VGTPDDVGNLSAIVERLLDAEVTQLEARLNNGDPFPEIIALPRGSRKLAK
jgi:hypothetical protein